VKENTIAAEHEVLDGRTLKVDYLQYHGRGLEKQEELRPYTRRLRTNNVILDHSTASTSGVQCLTKAADSFAGITRLMPIARSEQDGYANYDTQQEGCLMNTYASMEQAHLRSSRIVEL
jgi:hypothetical protein